VECGAIGVYPDGDLIWDISIRSYFKNPNSGIVDEPLPGDHFTVMEEHVGETVALIQQWLESR
jgi:hypothetical protein